tara:strand:- start:117 stop:614 length:498 start_codon:yes stop_codon:yes gene_type:complete
MNFLFRPVIRYSSTKEAKDKNFDECRTLDKSSFVKSFVYGSQACSFDRQHFMEFIGILADVAGFPSQDYTIEHDPSGFYAHIPSGVIDFLYKTGSDLVLPFEPLITCRYPHKIISNKFCKALESDFKNHLSKAKSIFKTSEIKQYGQMHAVVCEAIINNGFLYVS